MAAGSRFSLQEMCSHRQEQSPTAHPEIRIVLGGLFVRGESAVKNNLPLVIEIGHVSRTALLYKSRRSTTG